MNDISSCSDLMGNAFSLSASAFPSIKTQRSALRSTATKVCSSATNTTRTGANVSNTHSSLRGVHVQLVRCSSYGELLFYCFSSDQCDGDHGFCSVHLPTLSRKSPGPSRISGHEIR